MTSFDSWDNELYHHGIKGQKWGIRRYQNPDGTLTEAGRKRVMKTNFWYLNPRRKNNKLLPKNAIKNREKISDQYVREFWRKVDQGMPENSPSKAGKALWDKYKSPYAGAVLKDLGLADTKKGREQVQKIFAELDPDYEY